jgi:malate dehydrogenase
VHFSFSLPQLLFKAICDHVRDWHLGTGGRIVSMAIPSGAYNIAPGLIFSYPVRVDASGQPHVVQGLPIDDYSRKMLETTQKELLDEWSTATTFLN